MPTLKKVFPNGKFTPPAKDEDILAVEKQLGIVIPSQLKTLYLEANGFREDKGNAKYLLSLAEEDSIGSLVSITRHMWTEYETPNFKEYVFFGSSATDYIWGMNVKNPEEIIAYHYSMGDEFEYAGRNVIDIYMSDFKIYDQLT